MLLFPRDLRAEHHGVRVRGRWGPRGMAYETKQTAVSESHPAHQPIRDKALTTMVEVYRNSGDAVATTCRGHPRVKGEGIRGGWGAGHLAREAVANFDREVTSTRDGKGLCRFDRDANRDRPFLAVALPLLVVHLVPFLGLG